MNDLKYIAVHSSSSCMKQGISLRSPASWRTNSALVSLDVLVACRPWLQKLNEPSHRERADYGRPIPVPFRLCTWSTGQLERRCLANGCCSGDFFEFSCFNVVAEAVNRDVVGNERVAPNSQHVLSYALGIVSEGLPKHIMACDGAAAVIGVGPLFAVEFSGFKIVLKQIADDFTAKKLHVAVAVMNDKSFPGAEQLV